LSKRRKERLVSVCVRRRWQMRLERQGRLEPSEAWPGVWASL
jgi:hypothetical protein